jgi:eukaryotic-like serine/threonine-protein kinase
VTGEPPLLREGAELAPGYEVVEHLHRSRTLDVYDVWSEERDCRCAAKVLRPDRERDRTARRRLLAEGRLLETLTHPHIVRAYETLERPLAAVILETLAGETLGHMIESRRRRLALSDLAHLGIHLCAAMHYLHRHGMVHLDVKPSNVVSDCGRAKVIDLSIARPPGRVSAGVGTRQYLSPEQARGGSVGAAADVWGIGAVLHEASTGRRPFGARDGAYEQLERRADPVRAHRRLPAPLARAIDACLEPDPGARPALAELASVLEQAVEGRA